MAQCVKSQGKIALRSKKSPSFVNENDILRSAEKKKCCLTVMGDFVWKSIWKPWSNLFHFVYITSTSPKKQAV